MITEASARLKPDPPYCAGINAASQPAFVVDDAIVRKAGDDGAHILAVRSLDRRCGRVG
jgi:hypothetical protein